MSITLSIMIDVSTQYTVQSSFSPTTGCNPHLLATRRTNMIMIDGANVMI